MLGRMLTFEGVCQGILMLRRSIWKSRAETSSPRSAAVAAAGAPPYQGQGQPCMARPAPVNTAESVSADQPADAWRAVVWRQGSDGESLCRAVVAVRAHRATGRSALGVEDRGVTTGPEGWLIGERPLPDEHGDARWYFCQASDG